jgi:membrane associated rhomboid family serine protease
MILRSRPPRNPRAPYQYPGQTKPSGSEYYQSQPPPPKPLGSGSPTLIVGTIIVGCVGLFGYNELQIIEIKRNGSKKAYQWLQTFNDHFVLSTKNIREGRYYVLLTHTLAHNNFMHLAFNMLALWGFGRTIVSWYGLQTFAIIWVGSAVVGGILQFGYWQKADLPSTEHGAVGASGAIFGIVSALSLVYPEMPVLMMFIPMNLRWCMIISVAFSMASIKEGWLPWLGHVDHLGGMTFGFVWWLIALRRGRIGRLF